MNNVLKFLIKLQADAGNLFAATRQTTQQLNNIEQAARRTGRAIANAFSPSSLRSALATIPGMQALANPYVMMATAVGTIAKIGAEAEMTSTMFTALVGNVEEATSMLGELRKFTNETPIFSHSQLVEVSSLMINIGVEANRVIPIVKQLGDISGGSTERLHYLAVAFGQVSSTGYLRAQELNQFVNAGFSPLQELSKMTGKGMGELRDLMEKGAISADHVAQAIAHATGEGGKFHDLQNKMAQSTKGQFNAALNALSTTAINLYQSLQPYLLALVKGLNKAIPVISSALKGLFDLLTAGIDFVKEWGGELLLLGGIIAFIIVGAYAKVIAIAALKAGLVAVSIATKGWTAVQTVLNAVLAMNPIGMVITAIGILVAVTIYCWNKFAGFRAFMLTMWDVFKGFGDIIKDYVIDRLKDLLSGLGKIGEALKLLFEGEFSLAADKALEGYSELTGVKALTNAAQKTQSLAQGRWQENLLAETAKDVGKGGSSILDTISGGISVPGLKGSESTEVIFGDGKSKKKNGKGGKSGEAIATGGTRNTQITMTIGKLVESLNVHMMDKADSGELERMVVQSLNRSLAIATSTDR